MSEVIAVEALKHWGLENASIVLAAQRENLVYRVDDATSGRRWALRLHRPGLRSKAELVSESYWLQLLSESGLSVPSPVISQSGALCIEVAGLWVDLQGWLPGEPIIQHAEPYYYRLLGQTMANLHDVTDGWEIPSDFQRHAWNRNGLVGDNPVWGRFWDNSALNKQQIQLFKEFRVAAAQALAEKYAALDYGLIHADLVSENVLVNDRALHLIDFDDSGYGYRLFDLATVILRLRRDPDQEDLVDAFIDGYISERSLDLDALNLFLALRACTYLGWIISRQDETDGKERCARYISTGCATVESWLQQSPEHR